MRRNLPRGRARGFTLIELMFVVGLIGIMATLAVGMTTNWRRRNQLNTVTREIYNSLNIARGTAIKRSTYAHVEIALNKPYSVTVFIDSNDNHAYNAGADSLVYQFPTSANDWPGVPPIVPSLEPPLDTANTGLPVMIFDAYGFHVDVNGEPIGGAIKIHDQGLGAVQYVDITIAGALRIR